MTRILNEGLKHLDMENQVIPFVGIDQFKSSVGSDANLITLNFIVKGAAVGEDLSEWFEKGYDFVIESEVSPGEVVSGKYYVYVEIERRITSPKNIIELIEGLETLTGLKIEDWTLKIGDKTDQANVDFIKTNLITSPREYKKDHEDSLNEWREIAGINTVSTYDEEDEYLKTIKRQAGIY